MKTTRNSRSYSYGALQHYRSESSVRTTRRLFNESVVELLLPPLDTRLRGTWGMTVCTSFGDFRGTSDDDREDIACRGSNILFRMRELALAQDPHTAFRMLSFDESGRAITLRLLEVVTFQQGCVED